MGLTSEQKNLKRTELLEEIHHWLKGMPYKAPEIIEEDRAHIMEAIENLRD